MAFDFLIIYKQGKDNRAVDALSRRQEENAESSVPMSSLHPLSLIVPNWISTVKEEMQVNNQLQNVVQSFKQGKLFEDWNYRDGVLYFKGQIYLDHQSSLVVVIVGEMYSQAHEGFEITQ